MTGFPHEFFSYWRIFIALFNSRLCGVGTECVNVVITIIGLPPVQGTLTYTYIIWTCLLICTRNNHTLFCILPNVNYGSFVTKFIYITRLNRFFKYDFDVVSCEMHELVRFACECAKDGGLT